MSRVKLYRIVMWCSAPTSFLLSALLMFVGPSYLGGAIRVLVGGAVVGIVFSGVVWNIACRDSLPLSHPVFGFLYNIALLALAISFIRILGNALAGA